MHQARSQCPSLPYQRILAWERIGWRVVVWMGKEGKNRKNGSSNEHREQYAARTRKQLPFFDFSRRIAALASAQAFKALMSEFAHQAVN